MGRGGEREGGGGVLLAGGCGLYGGARDACADYGGLLQRCTKGECQCSGGYSAVIHGGLPRVESVIQIFLYK